MNFLKVVMLFGMAALFPPACGGPVEGGGAAAVPEEDTTPPVFLNGDPQDEVTRACSVTAEFDDPILASSVTNQSFVIYDINAEAQLAATDGTWGISDSSSTIALFTPSINLVGSYTVTVTTAITNTAGLNLAANESWSFEASQPCVEEDTTPPVLLNREPEGVVNQVCSITAIFDDPIQASSVTPQSFIIKSDSAEPLSTGDGTWGLSSTSDHTALFVPSVVSLVGTFTVTLTTDITNTAGLNLAEPQSWTFTAINPCPP